MRRCFKCAVVGVTAIQVLAGPVLALAAPANKAPTPVADKKSAEAAVSLKVTGMT